MRTPSDLDHQLHASDDVESLERSIVEHAMSRTGARDASIFLWSDATQGLEIRFHIVDGVVVTLPDVVLRTRRDGRRNGIALWVLEHNQSYLCNDTSIDPHYAPYFLEVLSIIAAPISYQQRAIGVISVGSRSRNAFTPAHLEELETLAASSAKFLRRAQLLQSQGSSAHRPLMLKGLSPEWLEVERRIEQVSATDAPVLITGESGTGKELVAHSIHFNSRRAGKPFISVNCAAIPETLLESTLFGHVRGAFTGASFDRIGEFQKADSGTLFLDEIGELTLPLQAKILRSVEYGEFLPLGSNAAPLRADVRLLAATHRDLPAMVRQSLFRQDLFFRLNVVTLELPPLRTYKHNLEILVRVFLGLATKRHGRKNPGISLSALEALRSYDFPGNVRELRNIVEHAVIMAAGKEIEVRDLPELFHRSEDPPASRSSEPRRLKDFRESCLAPAEKRYLHDLLHETGGNLREAAKLAGVNVVTLYRLLRKRGLRLGRQVQTAHDPR